uniref:Uncharacterized protein n=1 Tax=Romanomermis culicivorax TaxID=13658 RepID=A0A915JSG5_ROMCU
MRFYTKSSKKWRIFGQKKNVFRSKNSCRTEKHDELFQDKTCLLAHRFFPKASSSAVRGKMLKNEDLL